MRPHLARLREGVLEDILHGDKPTEYTVVFDEDDSRTHALEKLHGNFERKLRRDRNRVEQV